MSKIKFGGRWRHAQKLALIAIGFSMLGVNAGVAQMQLFSSLQLLTSQVYYISDFDITGGGSAADLFRFQVTNGGPAMNVTLRIVMRSDRSPQPIVEGTTRSFLIPLQGTRVFTYRDFRGMGNNPDVVIDRFNYNPRALGEITDAVLRTGRLPNGRYVITIEVRDAANGGVATAAEEEIVIISPGTLALISPGNAAGQGECPAIFSNLPQFKWDSDADKFLITICEALPTNNSPEDVMQNPPRVQATLMRGTDFMGTPVFQYPATALPLMPGKTYYWQVIAQLTSTSGLVQLPSEIWCFRLQGYEDSRSQAWLQELLSLLQGVNGADPEKLFGAGGPLAGFKPTGVAIINSRRIDLEELFAMLRNQSVAVKAVEVE